VTAQQLTCPLAAAGRAHREVVGGKAAALAELTAAGIPVPPGFAVTTAAFARALAAIDPGGAIPARVEALPAGDRAAIAATAAQVRGQILAAPLPAAVREAIAAGYRGLAPGTGAGAGVPVAVRSSATGEDSAVASFAGLADTYLWVQGEQAVADHVRRCWASLYSTESVSYRRHQGLPERGLAMAVVVQAMVDPRCAGVMFTRSPVTGDPSVIVVEASWGLGSALVSGEVTPDSYMVSKVTGEILRRAVSVKPRCHRRDASGTGVSVQEVPAALRDAPCLADDELRALARLGQRVSDHYGAPQDIEWALAGPPPGGFVLLQSRPETVWSRRRAEPVARPKAHAFDHVLDRLSAPARPPGAGT
jgi:phosphoenolpyruvate synthase/pyruvate phosphate dikinase